MEDNKKLNIKATMVLATDILGRIGYKNDLIYKDKEDMEIFKGVAKDSILIVGRKTYESFPKEGLRSILSRNNSMIVLSRSYLRGLEEGVVSCSSIDNLDSLIEETAKREGKNHIVLAGGSITYNPVFISLLSSSKKLDIKFEAYVSVFIDLVDVDPAESTFIDLAAINRLFPHANLVKRYENFNLYKLH